jgi:hypothetical protein
VLRIRDPVFFYPLDPGSGYEINFSRSGINYLSILPRKLAPETKRSKKNGTGSFMFHPSFYVGSGVKKCSDPGWKNVRIRDPG